MYKVSVGEDEAYFCRTCDGSDLRVEVGALREVLHHHRTGVMQQRLLVNCVLHLWDLLQIRHLEAFSLDTRTHGSRFFSDFLREKKLAQKSTDVCSDQTIAANLRCGFSSTNYRFEKNPHSIKTTDYLYNYPKQKKLVIVPQCDDVSL